MPLLKIEKLTMRFGGLTAVCDLDLEVTAGAIDSVIGPNGAGKTTVFNAITGIYAPLRERSSSMFVGCVVRLTGELWRCAHSLVCSAALRHCL